MENKLCTPDDFRENEKLHRLYADAKRERERRQPQLDQLEHAFEDARMRLDAAQSSGSTPAERVEELRAAVNQAEAARDAALKAADAPLQEAETALRHHTGRFIGAASGWADHIRQAHDDDALTDYVFSCRRELEGMLKRITPLPLIDAYFQKMRDALESWQLPKPADNGWIGTQRTPQRMQFPRLQDWL